MAMATDMGLRSAKKIDIPEGVVPSWKHCGCIGFVESLLLMPRADLERQGQVDQHLSTFPAWLSMGVYTPLVLLNKENYNFLNINDTYKRRTYFSKKVLVLFYLKANKIVTKLAYQCPFWV